MGMAPTEARLYTLEARQRTEENKNIHIMQTLQDEIDQLKAMVQENRKKKRPKMTVMESVEECNQSFLFSPKGNLTPSPQTTGKKSVPQKICEHYTVPPLTSLSDNPEDTSGKQRSVSPFNHSSGNKTPKNTVFLKLSSSFYPEQKVDERATNLAIQGNISLPISPAIFSRLSNHESVRFDKLLPVQSYDVSPEMQQMIDRQRQTIDKVNKIKAEAVKDSNGKVTPEEYGRMLSKMVDVTGGYRSLKHIDELITDYVQTLQGPLDPEDVLMDMGAGKFSRLLLDEINKEMRASMNHDL